MSKQSDAKEAQNYRRELDKCESCAHFQKEVKEFEYQAFSGLQKWTEDKNLRCGIGGFKVHKMAVCDRFERKAD
jgi:hypothetical protein